jgi:hypothetical protein
MRLADPIDSKIIADCADTNATYGSQLVLSIMHLRQAGYT